jgi:hypothetical protein
MAPIGHSSSIVSLPLALSPDRGVRDADQQKGAGYGKMIDLRMPEAATRRHLANELVRLETWPTPDYKKVQVLIAGSADDREIEIRCRRCSMNSVNPVIALARPLIEIAGADGARLRCSATKIAAVDYRIDIFARIDVAYLIDYRSGDLAAFPAVRFVYIGLPGNDWLAMANVHFDPKGGSLRLRRK